MNKAIFLDKDGTIVSDLGYPESIPRDTILVSETIPGLNRLQAAGYKLVIISNQSWIAKGKMTAAEVEGVFQSVLRQFRRHNVAFDGYYYCPHPSRGSTCSCRKPKTELFERATRELGLDPKQSYMVGDLPTDIQAGFNFGLKTCLVGTGKGKALRDEGVIEITPDWHLPDVNHFAQMLLG